MGNYLPNTTGQRQEMLATLGLSAPEELFSPAPAHLLLENGPTIPEGKSELETRRAITALADRNTVYPTLFRGAGAYRHYIPSIVGAVSSKEAFVTAYTPYQAEISQGILQSIFEYQTMICSLTGMDAANASVYDGATAAAEAVAMCRDRKRTKTLVSAAAHPQVIETIRTYCRVAGTDMELIPQKDGVTDLVALEVMLEEDVASVYLQQPSYVGRLEDGEAAAKLAHQWGARLVMGINPIAAAVLKSPGECGADIAVGEGQPLGIPLSFGGPYLGFMAATAALARRLPGRIAGETRDAKGNRAFVLTLQAREQHIRREKASSNICSNQALCALTATAYLAAMGPHGLEQVAQQCVSKAHYLAAQLEAEGFARLHQGPFFHEFATGCPVDREALLDHLAQNGILGGLPLPDGGLLWCATETNTKEEMDHMIGLIQSFSEKEVG